MQLLHWDVATGRPLVQLQHGQRWATSTAVWLAADPCVYKGSTAQRRTGNSSHTACVRLAADGRRLLSAGAADCCVLQWQVVGPDLCGAAADGLQLCRGGNTTFEAQGEGGVDAASAVAASGAKGGETLASMGLSQQQVTEGVVKADYIQRKVAELHAELDKELERIQRRSRCAGVPVANMYVRRPL